MLNPDVEIVGLDGEQLHNWWRLALPPSVNRESTWAVVFVEDGAVVGAIRSHRGQLAPSDVPYEGHTRRALSRLRVALGVGGVAVVEPSRADQVLADINRGLRFEDDYATQWLTVLSAAKKVSGRGVWTDPPLLDLVPIIQARAVQTAFDVLIPDGTSMVAYVLDDDGGGVHASVIATKMRGQIDTVCMHPAVEDVAPATELAAAWRSRYRRVNQAVSDRFAPPSVSVFLERATLRRILGGPGEQLAQELAARNIIIDPIPGWLTGLLGGAAAVAVATKSAKAFSRFLPASARRAAGALASSAQARMKDMGAHPFSLLGFDPIELWRSFRQYYQD